MVAGLSGRALAQCNDLPAGALDTCFNARGFSYNGIDSAATIHTVAPMPDGRLVVAGQFTAYRGHAVPGILRLFQDGSIDTSFHLEVDSISYITSAARDHAGRILLSYAITNIQPTNLYLLQRFTENGKHDTTFHAPRGSGSIIPQENGKIVLAPWTHEGPSHNLPGMHRLNEDGSYDSTFRSYISNQLYCAIPDRNGAILTGNGGEYPFPPVSRTTQAGLTDSAFHYNVLNVDSLKDEYNAPIFSNRQVYTLAADTTGKIYFGGLTEAGDQQTMVTHYRILFGRLNPSGTLDQSYPMGGFSGRSRYARYGWGYIQNMICQTNGNLIVVGGGLTGFRGKSVPGICRLTSDGRLDTTFVPGSGIDTTLYGTSVRIIPAPNNTAYIVGNYKGYNGSGIPYLNRISIKPRSAPTGTVRPGPGVMPGVILQPNPTTGRVTITSRGYTGPVHFVMATGRTAMTLPMSGGTLNADVSTLPHGLYLVKCGAKWARLVRQ